jgi:hypothetical protein
MPQHDEILTMDRGRVTHVMARGLTTYTCCMGLAPSPRGRYVAFTQTDAYLCEHDPDGIQCVLRV